MKNQGKPGDMMRHKKVQYLTENDEEFVNLLVQIGTKKNVAKVLVFLANAKKATQRMIERGADLRQSEVSLAISRMKERGWVAETQAPSERKGRPNKQYRLAIPISRILSTLEQAAREQVDRQLGAVDRIRSFA